MPDDFDLDDAFPLGDGTAENSAEVVCPHCGETTTISIDAGSGTDQEYIEDCEVCCNPWLVHVRYVGGTPDVVVTALDE